MVEQPSPRRVQMICLMVLSAATVIYFIYWLRPVLVPFVVSIFVVCGVEPILKWLEDRLHVNRLIAARVPGGVAASMPTLVERGPRCLPEPSSLTDRCPERLRQSTSAP